MVKIMKPGVEVRKVDKQGRLIIPADWRKDELKDSDEVFIIKEKGFLKIVPKKRVNLRRFFDSVDLGMNVGEWDKFEEQFYEISGR